MAIQNLSVSFVERVRSILSDSKSASIASISGSFNRGVLYVNQLVPTYLEILLGRISHFPAGFIEVRSTSVSIRNEYITVIITLASSDVAANVHHKNKNINKKRPETLYGVPGRWKSWALSK